ncbi:MAG: hypothetical protein KF722_15745 [Nitrospira sp.]|nr:hypothetical protein [Nitrospira sp.]
MSKPKHIDADLLIRQYYEGKDTGDEGAFPEDTMESVASIRPSSNTPTPDATLSGGDIDAARSGTDAGEETVGGSNPTPDQNVVQELGKAVGITYEDAETLRFDDKLADRDAHRWELNPASSEGYQERLQELTSQEISASKRPQTKRQKQTVRSEQGASSRKRSIPRKTKKKRH